MHLAQDLKENFEAGHVCWDERDLGVGGKPTGAIRASLGALSTIEEVRLLIRLISHYFVYHNDGSDIAGRMDAVCQGGSRAEAMEIPTLAAGVHSNHGARNAAGDAVAATAASQSNTLSCPASEPSSFQLSDNTAPLQSRTLLLREGVLTHMFIYPVKSCSPVQVKSLIVDFGVHKLDDMY
jgi:hypothetical protein